MSLLSVSAEDRRINKEDWGVKVKIISPITGESQTKDYLNSENDLKSIQIRYHHTEADTETGLEIIQDRPVVTLNYDSIDQGLLGGIPETETGTVRWACFIPPQFNPDGNLEPYIVYKVLKTGTLKDLKLYLRKPDDEI